MEDQEKFEALGLHDGQVFRLRELSGRFKLDIKNKCIYDVTKSPNGCTVVQGVYQTLLRGKYKVKS